MTRVDPGFAVAPFRRRSDRSHCPGAGLKAGTTTWRVGLKAGTTTRRAGLRAGTTMPSAGTQGQAEGRSVDGGATAMVDRIADTRPQTTRTCGAESSTRWAGNETVHLCPRNGEAT
jgi:hypothetical protein